MYGPDWEVGEGLRMSHPSLTSQSRPLPNFKYGHVIVVMLSVEDLKAKGLAVVEDAVQILKESGSIDGSNLTEEQYNRMREKLQDLEPIADALGKMED